MISKLISPVYLQALALAMAYQAVTNHHIQRPPINDFGPNDKIPDDASIDAYHPGFLVLEQLGETASASAH